MVDSLTPYTARIRGGSLGTAILLVAGGVAYSSSVANSVPSAVSSCESQAIYNGVKETCANFASEASQMTFGDSALTAAFLLSAAACAYYTAQGVRAEAKWLQEQH